MNIKTPSDLKYWHQQLNPESSFFTHNTMRFFGDTMRNYGIKTHDKYFELYRKRAVNDGLRASAYFDKLTLNRIPRPI